MRIFVGADQREPLSHAVTVKSLRLHCSAVPAIQPLGMIALQQAMLYRRPTEHRDGMLFDAISGQPMSTEFSLARFWVPYLCRYEGWALFVDGDWLFRDDVGKLFALADERYAVMVVKHFHDRDEAVKMDGQVQKHYPRKLWSSLMLFNCGHESCRRLDSTYLNTASYSDLHEFRWCKDEEIGDLPMNWHVVDMPVKGYHFTLGTPELGVRGSPFDDEWMTYLTDAEREKLP